MMSHPSAYTRLEWATVSAMSATDAEIRIYGDIGEDWWEPEESNTAKKMVEILDGISAEYITVRINSFGGQLVDALAIFNALRRHPAAVTVEIDGVAMSAASLIAMAGDTVRMAENAVLMIHAPLTYAYGNAEEMRRIAEMLDTYAEAMSSAYARNDVTQADALALLRDGEDHYYTAAEALEGGFIDEISDALPIAASARMDLSRFNNLPAAAAAFNRPEKPPMAQPDQKPAAATQTADDKTNVSDIQAAAQKKERERIQARNTQIEAAYSRHMEQDGVPALYAQQIANPETTLEQSQSALLAHLGSQAEPHNGATRVNQTVDERDKFKAGAKAAVLARMGVEKDDRSNEYRGRSLAQLAETSILLAGGNPRGMTKSEIASRVLAAHSTSDFPYLLADAANKRLQAAYDAFPSTWQAWCGVGEVSDFKTVNLIRMGTFNSLDIIPEGEEYKQGTVDEEREQLTPATKGKYIQLTRQMIINDDLNGFSRMAAMLGRAAARTVNADAYGIINANAAMSDSVELFHADHGNLAGSGAAVSVATLSAGRTAMRKQTAPGTNATEYLNIMPRSLLVPVVAEDNAREVVSSTTNIAKSNSRARNPIQDWGPLEIVSDPYLDATSVTAWYLAADPMDAPLVEVHFLDGNQTPFIDEDEEFLTDAIRWKVRLDYGLAANDYRGGYKNAGA